MIMASLGPVVAASGEGVATTVGAASGVSDDGAGVGVSGETVDALRDSVVEAVCEFCSL